MTADDIVAELRRHGNPDNVAGMARYGIASTHTLGVNIPTLRSIAKRAAATMLSPAISGLRRSTRRASWPRWSTNRRR